jgi:hypothetical protein
MQIPTKEELEKQRVADGLTEECPDFRFGGEVDGVIEFARDISVHALSRADETFLSYLIYGSYPYDLDGLVFWWENDVMRDGTEVRFVNGEPKYSQKYTERQKEQMALSWFDRRIGKLVRIGALQCSVNTPFLNSLKQGFKLKNFVEIIEQKLLAKQTEAKETNAN